MQSYATETYLSALIDSTEDFIWSVDLDFKIVVLNRATARSFEAHYGRPLSPGMRHHEQLPPEQGAQWAAFYQRAISEGPFQIERTFPDGPTRDLYFSPIIVDGAITGISVFSKNITKRIAEEKARLEAERKYREIFDGALEGIFQASPDGQFLTANQALATMLGYDSPEELVALDREARRTLWVDPEQASKYLQLLEENGEVRRFEAQFRRKDGAIIWTSFNCRRVLAIDGKTIINEGFTEDITDRKLAEMELRQREEHMKHAECLAQMGHTTWDVDSKTPTWSEGVYRILGLDPTAPLPQYEDRARLFSPESWARVTDAMKHAVATGEPYNLELQVVRADGCLRWVRARGQAVRNVTGRIHRLITTLQDVTEQRAEEKARLEAERKYREIFDNALEGIFQVATDGSLLTANRAFATILGYDSPEEVLALVKYRLTVWVDPERVSKYLQLLEENGAVRRFETEARRKDGAIIWISFTSHKAFAIDGKTPIVQGFIEDITDRKLAELQILERDNKLREAEALAHLGHFSWDPESRTTTWSEGLYKIAGWDPNQPGPNDYERTKLYSPEDWKKLDEAAWHTVATGDPYDLELQMIRRDGALRWVRILGEASRDESGRVNCLFGTLQDITERRAQENARLEAERRYRDIFDNALEGIFQVATDGSLLIANRAFATILGYDSPEEVVALVEYRRTVWVDPERVSTYLQLLEETGVVRRFETEARRKDGTIIWVSFTSHKAFAIDGKTPIIEGFIEDITDRKLAELQILERDSKLREAEELAHLGHFSWETETNTLTWSEGLYKITGFDPNQPLNYSDSIAAYTPESRLRRDAAVQHSLATGDPYDLELQIVRRDGALRWVRARGFADRDQAGKVIRVFGTLQDITDQKLNEMTLRDNEERFRATFEQAGVGMMHVSFEGLILRCNKRFAEIVGYSPDEVVGMRFQQFTPPEYQPVSSELLNRFKAGHISEKGFEKPYVRKDGSLVWVRLTISVQRDGKGEPLHMVTFVEDITDRRLAEGHLAAAAKELQARAALHRTVFQTNLDALSISRISDGKFVDVNKKFLDITGFQREEVIGRTSSELGIWPDPSERQRISDELLRRSSGVRDEEVLLRRKNGESFWALISASALEYEGVPHFFIASRDISEAKEAVKTIRDLAFYDPLTHLPNRRSLLDLLEQTQNADSRLRALLFVDLDKFKSLNDAFGPQTGDLLLQESAQRLSACVRGEGTVARLGADEFAVVLEDLGNTAEQAAEKAEQTGERILAAEALPYLVGGRECHFSASIGITVFGSGLKGGLEALQQSEIAMSKAKEAGGDTIRFFSPELQATVNARVLLENELRTAIKEEEFELYFQPQVREGRLIGSESLIRWNHPKRGVLAPGAFIELAEDTGLILPLGNWVFENACKHIAAWAGKNRSGDASVAVNISGKQFSQPDFVESILATLDSTGANPESLKLELTETSLVKDFHDVVAKMTELKSHGLKFSVDDFGTGYSSLAYLRRLPLDQLKIDRAFVKDIMVDGPSGAIAQAIISMGHSMGFSVIAEGVETEEQRDFLIGIGCNSFQGYLYSRPVPADEFERTWLLCG